MPDLKKRELKMQERRKNTSRRDFLKEIVSFYPVAFHKNEGLISRFPPTGRVLVQKEGDFHATRDSLPSLLYDEEISLFENMQKLFEIVKLPSMISYGNNENCSFTDVAINAKNAYLSFLVSMNSENVGYSLDVKNDSRNVFNSVNVQDHTEAIYQSTGVINSSYVFYSRHIIDSFSIWFSTNLIGCQHCLLCNDLENKSYCIRNEQYEKHEFEQEKAALMLQKENFFQEYSKLDCKGKNFASRNVSGSFALKCEDVENCYYSHEIKNGRNVLLMGGAAVNENFFDALMGGSIGNAHFYGVCGAGMGCSHVYSSCHNDGSNIYYSYYTNECSFCLGCVGLKNKHFCILNKEYTKEEWFTLANKIFAQMDADGSLGAFFPGWLNPIYFNDSVAYLMDDSFTKEEVTKQGHLRRDEEIRTDIPPEAEVISVVELNQYQGFDDDKKWKINPEILKKVIKDDKGNYYKIVPMELDFLQKHGLPLPELHWLERIKLGFKFK